MLRPLVISYYQAAVQLSSVDKDLKKSLKTKERVPAFIDNLCREIQKLPPHLATQSKIQDMVHSMTNLFLDLVQKKANEDRLTIAAKNAIKETQAKANRMNELADSINKASDDNPFVIDAEELEAMANEK